MDFGFRLFPLKRPLVWVILVSVFVVTDKLVRGMPASWSDLPLALSLVAGAFANHILAAREVRAALRDRRTHGPLERVR